MKLREYVSGVSSVLAKHRRDAGNNELFAEVRNWEKGKLIAGFNRVYLEIRDCLAKNKNLLGVHQRSGKGPDKPDVLAEREIDPVNLKRHIRAVWSDLGYEGGKINSATDPLKRYEKPESIKAGILNELAAVLGVNDMSDNTFGIGEDGKDGAEIGREIKKIDSQQAEKTDRDDSKAVHSGIKQGMSWGFEARSGEKDNAAAKGPKEISTGEKPSKEKRKKEVAPSAKNLHAKIADPRETMSAILADMPPRGTPEYDLFTEIFIRWLREEGKLK
jgi:hypothetical protein